VKPRLVARWAITANGAAWVWPSTDSRPRIPPGCRDLAAALGELEAPEIVVEGDAEMVALAFELGLVDRVECRIVGTCVSAPSPLVTGGVGPPTVDEGWRLEDIEVEVEDDAVVIRGRVAR
jgi:hypothetical protein